MVCFSGGPPAPRAALFLAAGRAPPPPTEIDRRAAADTMTSAHSSKLGYSAPGDKTGNLRPLIAVSGHSTWTLSPRLPPVNRLAQTERTVRSPTYIYGLHFFHQSRFYLNKERVSLEAD